MTGATDGNVAWGGKPTFFGRHVHLGLSPHQPAGGAVASADAAVVFLGVTPQVPVAAHRLRQSRGRTR